MDTYLIPILMIIITLWLGALTYLYFSSVRHYKKIKIDQADSLSSILEKLTKRINALSDGHGVLSDGMQQLYEKNMYNVKSVGVVRFNPFDEVGSDQSFSMALLDGKNNGIVLTSLHGKSGTRLYAKNIKEGSPQNSELSDEEKRALGLVIELS